MLKVQEIREIIKLIDQSSITEFTYETEGASVSLKKGNTSAPAVEKVYVTEEAAKPAVRENTEPAVQTVPDAETKQEDENKAQAKESDYDYEIVSPMVGTFYAAPSPEDEPYVSVGSQVEPHTVVCIVEAMKLFNEIEAEAAGEIVEIMAESGELVEYGQPLFRVKKK